MRKIADFIATGFYSGYLPAAPGTWGSALGISLLLVFESFYGNLGKTSILLISIIWLVVGILSSMVLLKYDPSDQDPSRIVIDEIAGQTLTFLLVPLTISNLIIGFILFRIFDIAKPYPVSVFDKWKGSLGIMLDDIMAAIYAGFTLWMVNIIFN